MLASYLSLAFGDAIQSELVIKKVHEDGRDKVVMELNGQRVKRVYIPNGEQVTFTNEIDEPITLTIKVDDTVTYTHTLGQGESITLTMGSTELPSGSKYLVSGGSYITLESINAAYGDFGEFYLKGPVGGTLLPASANNLMPSLAPLMIILVAAGLAATKLFSLLKMSRMQ